jgi:hypothetical protein
VHGFADLREGSFDFSEQEIVWWADPAADIGIGYVVDPPLGYMFHSCGNNSLMIAVSTTPLEELTEAPEDLGSYGCDGPIVIDLTYVVSAPDGVYAKFALRAFTSGDWIIEYYVQTDGSRNFVDPVAVSVSTWGRIKSLYHPRD